MDITPIVQAFIALLLTILTCFVIPLLREKVSADQFATIKMWVSIAVQAAEQIFVGSGKGKENKAYVIDFLESKGFNIDEDSIDNLIESAVLELKKATEATE